MGDKREAKGIDPKSRYVRVCCELDFYIGKAEVGSSILPGGTIGTQSDLALGPDHFPDISGYQ